MINDTNVKKFWAVWKEHDGSPPKKRHETLREAREEAIRLARTSQARFYILEVIGIAAPAEIPVYYEQIN